MKRFLTFAGKLILAHVVTYFVIGAIAYPLLTKPFYEGPNPVFATFMRSQAQPELWAHTMTWFLPGQVLRGLLIAAVLYPFFTTLAGWSVWKRFVTLSGLYLVLGFWAATVAAPGTIDGMIYMLPAIDARAHLLVQPEIVVQGLLLGAWVARWMAPRPGQAARSQAAA